VNPTLPPPRFGNAGYPERYPAYAKHSEAGPEWCGVAQIDRGKSAEPMPFDCERIVYRGVGRLITMEK